MPRYAPEREKAAERILKRLTFWQSFASGPSIWRALTMRRKVSGTMRSRRSRPFSMQQRYSSARLKSSPRKKGRACSMASRTASGETLRVLPESARGLLLMAVKPWFL